MAQLVNVLLWLSALATTGAVLALGIFNLMGTPGANLSLVPMSDNMLVRGGVVAVAAAGVLFVLYRGMKGARSGGSRSGKKASKSSRKSGGRRR